MSHTKVLNVQVSSQLQITDAYKNTHTQEKKAGKNVHESNSI